MRISCSSYLTRTACILFLFLASASLTSSIVAQQGPQTYIVDAATFSKGAAHDFESLRLALNDLIETFGEEYPQGPKFLTELTTIEQAHEGGGSEAIQDFERLRRRALLKNPLLDFESLLVLKRKRGQLGLPTNHQCNTCLPQNEYDNEIAMLSPVRPWGEKTTVYRPEQGLFVGETDLHFDASKLLFTMPNGRTWQLHELDLSNLASGDLPTPRQITIEQEGVDNFDGCYLPDGRIIFASTASYTGVPCWHGKERACSLYLANNDGTEMRQLCFDQDLDLHPCVMPTGQIIYSRWDYTGPMHIYLRPLMVMNPDGTTQRAVYGSNSYFPNCLFFPRPVPGHPTKIAAVLSGYHSGNRAGELAVLDLSQGWHEEDGILQRITHRDEPVEPIIRDNLTGPSWPKFLHPYPLSDKYILVASQLRHNAPWRIYLVDVFDNMVPVLYDKDHDYFEPTPFCPSESTPPAIPDRVDLAQDEASLYIHDIYAGPGLAGVPHGAVKSIRVAAYNYGLPGLAGPDKIGRAGPWEAIRILGTAPVHEDGSARFIIPANTPITLQPLDAEGRALQLMRTWYTAMPGEAASCVGCHEQPKEAPNTSGDIAIRMPVSTLTPWHGPARGFDFEREVQPVLDRYCVGCHDGTESTYVDGSPIPDLRGEEFAVDYVGLPLSNLGGPRLDESLPQKYPELFHPYPEDDNPWLSTWRMQYTPAYDVLIQYIRRMNVEDVVGLLLPGEYHADTSELIQMLSKGHHGVELDEEAWDRLYTWIDLNGPCHGTWGDICEPPLGASQRRWELAELYEGPSVDPEVVPVSSYATSEPIVPIIPNPLPEPYLLTSRPALPEWPFDEAEAVRRQSEGGRTIVETVTLPSEEAEGEEISIRMIRIPTGAFLMGGEGPSAPPEDQMLQVASVEREFWISEYEITNEQFRRFFPAHDSGVFTKRSMSKDGPGISQNEPNQPAIRVSWNDAMEFCRRLSEVEGRHFTLPTETQWEYAARAGSDTPLSYGTLDVDFSPYANMADEALQALDTCTGGVMVLLDFPARMDVNDGAIVTNDVGSYRPNAWGLYDMHGNAAEWTRTSVDGTNADQYNGDSSRDSSKIVRGGSFRDRPERCQSAYRLDYPGWRHVHNVGFRIILESTDNETIASK
jgi:formylglycine-generating enzyme required for sulfatase activity